MSYTVYTRKGCSYCEKTKSLLEIKKLDYTEKDIDRYKQKLLESYPSLKTLPVVFDHEGNLIGGYDDLVKVLGETNE